MAFQRVFNPRAWSLSVKLTVVLVLAALLPTILSVFFGINQSLEQVRTSEYANLELLASSTASRLDQLVNDSRYAVAQVAGSSDLIKMLSEPDNEAAKTSANLTALNTLYSNPSYEFVYATNASGKVVMSQQLPGLTTVLDLDVSGRDYYKKAIIGTPYVDVLVGSKTHLLGFYFSAPVRDANHNPIGVAIIKLQGAAVTDIVNQFTVGTQGYAFLIDQFGVIVSHPQKDLYYKSLVPLDKDTEIIVAKRFALGQCAADKPDTCVVDALDTSTLGQAMIGTKAAGNVSFEWSPGAAPQTVGFAPMSTLGWVVGVDKPTEEFQAPLLRLAQQAILIVVVIGVIVAVVGVLLAQGIARPMGKLAAAAVEIQNDRDFSPDDIADVRAQPDEVGNLARVFSDMVIALRARAAELHTIYEIGTKISSSIELAPTMSYLVSAVKGVIPYDGAEVCLYDEQNNVMLRQIAVNNRTGKTDTDEETYHLNGYLQYMVENRTGLLVPEIETFKDIEMGHERKWSGLQPRSYLGIVLKTHNQLVGTVELVSNKPNAFTQDNQRILESVAVQASVIIQNAREVETRERNLRVQIEQLKIEIDETKKAKQVAEITESSFFEELTRKAKEFRKASPKKAEPR